MPIMDRSSFSQGLQRVGVPREQANIHAELVWEFIRSELERKEEDRNLQFWNTFFFASVCGLWVVSVLVGWLLLLVRIG